MPEYQQFDIHEVGEPTPEPQPATPPSDDHLFNDLELFNADIPVEPAAAEPLAEPVPEPATTPGEKFAQDGADLGMTPESMAALEPDPFDAVGLTVDGFQQMANGAGLDDDDFLGENLETIASTLAARGLTSPADVSRFLGLMAEGKRERKEKQSLRDQVAANAAALEELRNTGPASPLDNRLARIEGMLSERQMQEEAARSADEEIERAVISHGGALDQLATIARTRGLDPPSGPEIAQWYRTNNAFALDPSTAARLAFKDLGCDGVFGQRPNRREQQVVRRGEERYQIIPGGATSGGGRRATVEDIFPDDDEQERVWTG